MIPHHLIPRPLITAVAIVAIMGTSAMALARSSVAQGEPALALPAPATVTLYHHTLEWQTLPHHFVTAWVTHTEGIRSDGRGGLVGQTGNGYGRADANGHAAVRLYGGPGGRFLPFDVVSLTTSDWERPIGEPYPIRVPELRVDVTPDGTAVVGRAAAGSSVALALDGQPTPAVVVADATARSAWFCRHPHSAAAAWTSISTARVATGSTAPSSSRWY